MCYPDTDVGHVLRCTMGYEWTQNFHDEQITLGHIPPWFTTTGSPVLALTLAPPAGTVRKLVRVEAMMKASMSAINDPVPVDPYQLETPVILGLVEVFDSATPTIPNPIATGVQRRMLTLAATTRGLSHEPADHSQGHHVWDTGGIVGSQAVRSPLDWGGGAPEVRLGVYTLGCFDPSFLGVTDCEWALYLAALWLME